MATNIGSFNTVRWIVLVLCMAGSHYGFANSTRLRDSVAAIYHSQVGVMEATGKNDGKQVEVYLKTTGLGKGNPWCAAFVAWVYLKSGVKAIRSAYSPSWFVQNKRTSAPKKGDLFGLYFKALGRIGHVGFYDADAGAFILTVEGNTNDAGSREGDRVAKKRRLKRQIRYYANWID